jgi:hypothetical protein
MSEHDQFYQLLSNYPDLADIWNQDEHTYDPEAAQRYLRTASGGEVTLLKCLISIWNGGDQETLIDFTDLVILDPTTRQPLINWLTKPFFP